jgi:hypothetical protein
LTLAGWLAKVITETKETTMTIGLGTITNTDHQTPFDSGVVDKFGNVLADEAAVMTTETNAPNMINVTEFDDDGVITMLDDGGVMSDATGLVEGDRIRLEGHYGTTNDFTVEKFRDCLGVFWSDAARKAGSFTPLCEMYGHGAGSENSYISNYGEYVKNPVALWMQLPRIDGSKP